MLHNIAWNCASEKMIDLAYGQVTRGDSIVFAASSLSHALAGEPPSFPNVTQSMLSRWPAMRESVASSTISRTY